MGEFVSDIKQLRERARKHIDKGAVTDGYKADRKRVIDVRRYLQTTAAISPGSSGGGLFDASGNLVGITTMTLRGTQNINFAIPAEDFWK